MSAVSCIPFIFMTVDMFFKPKKKKNTLKTEIQYMGNMPRSESPDAKQPINRLNIKLHNVSHQRSPSQSMSAFSCISFILLTIDMSSCSRIEKLLSSYSSESAEWKVLHKKNKKLKKLKKKKEKENTNVHLLHLVNFTEFRPFYIRYYSVWSGRICQNCIADYWSF